MRLVSYISLLFVFSSLAFASEPAQNTVPRRIGEIRVEIRDIFDEKDLGDFYRVVNRLKLSTRKEVIRRELLFKEGDAFDEFFIEESERNLRSLPFLRQVTIIPIEKGDVVDIVVSVQDTWTLYPFINLSSGSGDDKKAIGLVDTNLFGFGKRLEVLYADDEGREKIEGVWDDRRFLGTYQHLTLGYFSRSDGYRNVGYYGRPFRSLVEPYSWALNTDFSDLVDKLFEAGDERFIFRHERQAIDSGFTFASGDPETLLRRYTFGYGYYRDAFEEANEKDYQDVDVDPDSVSHDAALLAEDRKFSGPVFGLQQIEPDYISLNYIDRFDRIEDFNLGNQLGFKLHLAGKVLGSFEDTLIMGVSDSDGYRISPTSFIRAEMGAVSRLDSDGFDNTIAHGEVKYYNALGPKYVQGHYIGRHTLAASLVINLGEDLDKDKEFLLGAGSGLRGYKSRTFTGDHRLVLNLEERFHLVEDVLRLFHVGGAVFVDAGGASVASLGRLVKDELYADVGFGLRIGLPRSSQGTVIRVDVAYPLRNGPDGSGVFEPRILFTMGQEFSAKFRSDFDAETGSNVQIKFLD